MKTGNRPDLKMFTDIASTQAKQTKVEFVSHLNLEAQTDVDTVLNTCA